MNNYHGHFKQAEEQGPETQGTVDFLLEWKEREEAPGGDEAPDATGQDAGETYPEADTESLETPGEESFNVSREAHTFMSPGETEREPPPGSYEVSFQSAAAPPPPPEGTSRQEAAPQGAPRNPWDALSGLVEKDSPKKKGKSPLPHQPQKSPFHDVKASRDAGTSPGNIQIPSSQSTVPPPHPGEKAIEEKGEESFEWTVERHRAIEEALRETSDIRLPTVHSQLEGLRRSLQDGSISKDRALVLLAEVEQYLNKRLDDHKKKVTVAHEAIISARSDLLKGLQAYQESANSLREYLSTGELLHLDLSIYTADQAASFVSQAKRTVFEAQPEAPATERQEAKSL